MAALLPLFSHAILLHSPETVASTWPTDGAGKFSGNQGFWGAHRIQVSVEPRQNDSSSASSLVLVEVLWRRRDVHPEKKDVRITYHTNSTSAPVEVKNRVVLSLNGSATRLLFDTSVSGSGKYDIYFLPVVSNGMAFGRKNYYQPLRRTGSSRWSWLTALEADGWKLYEEAEGENAADFVAAHTGFVASNALFQAQTEHDLFTPMEVAATAQEVRALYRDTGTTASPALLLPYSNRDVVRTFAFVSTRYLDSGIGRWSVPKVMLLSARRNQYLVWQLAVVSVFDEARRRFANISSISVSFSDLVDARDNATIVVPARNLTCFNTDGVDPRGHAFALAPSVNLTLGSILPLWLGVDLGPDVSVPAIVGNVTVSATIDGQPGGWNAVQRYTVDIDAAAPPLLDRGDSDPSLLTRVRWLNSRFGLDNAAADNYDLPSPFTPPRVGADGATISLFAKTATVSATRGGMLSDVYISSPPYAPRALFAAGRGMELEVGGGKCRQDTDTVRTDALAPIETTGAEARWSHRSTTCGLAVNVSASLAYDGYADYTIRARPAESGRNVTVNDMTVRLPLAPETCRYILRGGGSGAPGANVGEAEPFEWQWTAGRCDNSFWVGSVHAGVRLRLRGPQAAWKQPRGPYHFKDLPPTNASLPPFWWNGGRGGARLTMDTDASGSLTGSCTLAAFTGEVTVSAAKPVELRFDLVITPNRPLTPQARFERQRYYQMESTLVAPDVLVHQDGVRIVNVHQGNPLNPWIIYPLDPVANKQMRNFSAQVRADAQMTEFEDVKVKTYYSSGSLSFITECLWAFFALYNEVIAQPHIAVDPVPPPTPPPAIKPPFKPTLAQLLEALQEPAPPPPPFGPHHWFSEHAGTASFSSDWTTPLASVTDSPVCGGCDMDVSFTTVANSRLANFWARALVLVTKETTVDGIYLDGVSYDAETMLRAKRAVSTGKGDERASSGMLDLHCGNRWPSGEGEVNVLEYSRHMALMDSIMMGEGFDDGGTHACANRSSGICGDATWMLLATSGLQFGVFNDMLMNTNLFRGMALGMAGRPPYSNADQNVALYRFWDESGLAAPATEVLGFWAGGYGDGWVPLVFASAAQVEATAYVVQPTALGMPAPGGRLVVAVASWATENATFTLRFDHAAIARKLPQWKPTRLTIRAPAIPLVQNAESVSVDGNLTVVPRGGILLLVET